MYPIRSSKNRALAALLASAAGLAACGEAPFEPAWEGASPPPNVLFVTVDTLRADHLGYDGYPKPTSPRIDEWAESATIFENTIASASWTLPGFATALTGYYPSTHRCWGFGSRLAPSFSTVTELLVTAGYDTACVTSHIFLATRYGLQQGFVHFDDSFAHPKVDPHASITSEMVSDKGIDFLEHKAAAGDGVPWFLWLHYFDPHDTFMFHEGFSEPFLTEGSQGVQRERELYDGEIRFTDHHIGRVLDRLRATGLGANTIVVFLSDHGEEFMDHDAMRHGHALWRELTRVPFAIAGPGLKEGRYAPIVRTVDLLPTMLDLVGLADRIPSTIEGASLAPILRGDGPAPETGVALSEIALSTSSTQKSLVDGRWKVIHDISRDEWALFDLDQDPFEENDLADSEPQALAVMRQKLIDRVRHATELAEDFRFSRALDLSSAESDNLRALGYLGDDQTIDGALLEDGE